MAISLTDQMEAAGIAETFDSFLICSCFIWIWGLRVGVSGTESAWAHRMQIDAMIPGSGTFLEEGMATHPSIPARGNPMDRGARRATVHGVVKRTGMTGLLST